MSYRFTRQRIRIEADVSKKDAGLVDRITGATPTWARSAALQVEVALFFGGELVDISNISAATLTFKDADTRSGTAQATATIGALAMNKGLTLAQWQAGGENDHHFKFTFASAAMGFGTGNTDAHWLVLHGLTDDDALDVDVFAAGAGQSFDAGIANVTSPAVPAEAGVTLSQVSALLQDFLRKNPLPGELLTLRSDNGLIRRVMGVDNDGNAVDSIEI